MSETTDHPDVKAILIAKLAESRGTTQDAVLEELERLGAIDSLEGVELITEAERVFKISVSDEELSSNVCQSIPTIVTLVQSKLAAASAAAEGKAKR